MYPNIKQILINIYLSLNSLQEMLQEYDRILDYIPVTLTPLMKPYIDRVEHAIRPGIEALSWTSLKVDECKDNFLIPLQ